jgi:hypothetical protein
MQDQNNGYRLVLLPCREPIPFPLQKLYKEAYGLWKLVWSDTLKELDNVNKLYSNEFTRYDFAAVIFKGDKAISLMCYTAVDMTLGIRQEDSWFSCWPENILEQEKQRGGQGLVAAFFCTHPDYRKNNNTDLNFSQITIEIIGKLLLDGKYSAAYGVTRNNRGVGKYSANAGSITLAKSMAHGCEVDLVVFEPHMIKDTVHFYSSGLKNLWNNRLDYRNKVLSAEGVYDEENIRKAA